MTTVRRFRMDDIFTFNRVNLDRFTETFNITYYMHYQAKWPQLFVVSESSPTKTISGYIMGKAEGKGEDWHGHVTAVTVAPEFRRLGLAKMFMNYLEAVSDKEYQGYFVDLFVRASNTVAVKMYERMGYVAYRQVLGYYSGEEDALDMRKALSRDKENKSMIPANPFKTTL